MIWQPRETGALSVSSVLSLCVPRKLDREPLLIILGLEMIRGADGSNSDQ